MSLCVFLCALCVLGWMCVCAWYVCLFVCFCVKWFVVRKSFMVNKIISHEIFIFMGENSCSRNGFLEMIPSISVNSWPILFIYLFQSSLPELFVYALSTGETPFSAGVFGFSIIKQKWTNLIWLFANNPHLESSPINKFPLGSRSGSDAVNELAQYARWCMCVCVEECE